MDQSPNQILLQGVIRDPEQLPRGGVKFLIDTGPMKFPLVSWNETAKTVRAIGDGTRVTITARLRSKAWVDAKGNTRWHVDIQAVTVQYESKDGPK